jgi:hypothetical protein
MQGKKPQKTIAKNPLKVYKGWLVDVIWQWHQQIKIQLIKKKKKIKAGKVLGLLISKTY